MPSLHPFSAPLIYWQKQSGRHDLPWQNTRDPYRIWLSEIMLQQTQVSTVIPYYLRFLDALPDVLALAAAPSESVLALWAGLGYYARARNLHRCAQAIAADYGGRFPATAAHLAKLPGIGRSTAAAIAAFAFGERAAILDGNVKRVLCRQFGIEGFPGSASVEKPLWELAEALLPADDIAIYTQGLMDLGATLCMRHKPQCALCPVAEHCVARRSGKQDELPASRPRPALPERSADYTLIIAGAHVLLERRPPSGIWGGLLTPPEGDAASVLCRLGLQASEIHPLPALKHSFTHFRLKLSSQWCHVEPATMATEPGLHWVHLAEAADAGVPTPIRKLLRLVASVAD